jgi:hypothetical protein
MDVIWLRQEGTRVGLKLTIPYLQASYKVLEDTCNGIGPEWFPEWVRDEVTDYFEYFLMSTNQHDFDFAFLKKSKDKFKEANDRLYKNMKIQIRNDRHLSWWHICKKTSRWRKYAQAKFLYEMCDEFGKSAFFTEEDK